MKACTECGKEKDESEFYKNRGGLQCYCKPCNNARSMKWHSEHRESRRETNNRYYANNREERRARKHRWREEHPDRVKAHNIVNNKISSGRLVRKANCIICGRSPTVAHHEDYKKPLAVTWLCYSCHALHHRGKLSLTEAI